MWLQPAVTAESPRPGLVALVRSFQCRYTVPESLRRVDLDSAYLVLTQEQLHGQAQKM